MGGSAFSLQTPRMPPPVYAHVRDHVLSILHTFYSQASSPLEAPEKADYGDIDIVATDPVKPFTPIELATALDAKEVKRVGTSGITFFAIPWPAGIEALKQFAPKARPVASATDHPVTPPEIYIQLDLIVLPTSTLYRWSLFHQAHGDLWSILGSMIRRFGLTATDNALYLRIAEIEAHNKSLSRIKLTDSPTEVLEFLDLEVSKYWSRFERVDELLAFAATCRFHDPRRGANDEKEKGDLTANDRQRAKKRPLFRKWLDEFVPLHQDDPPSSAAQMSRQDVVEEAKRTFGVGEEYEQKKAKGVREMEERKWCARVRKDLPVEGKRIGVIMRGLQREVIHEGEGRQSYEMSPCQRAYADGKFDEVAEWVNSDWEAIETRQKAYERARSTAHLLAKLERDRIKDAAGKEQNVEQNGDQT